MRMNTRTVGPATPGLRPLLWVASFHHQMQLSLRVGASEVFEEDEELLRAMARYAQPGDLAGDDILAANRVEVPCRA
jgi:hypothetical protein